MEEMNNNINPNQQPQPQEEEEKKKKNKFVAWWLGLGKWAKVGICAGTAAVLATAITLPIVLTNKSSGGDGGTYTFKSTGGWGYETDSFELKENYKYTFKLTLENGNTAVSLLMHSKTTTNNNYKIKNASVSGAQYEWNLDKDENVYKCSEDQEGEKDPGRTLTFTIVAGESASNVIASINPGGK